MFTFIHLNVKGSTAWTCNLFPSQRLSKLALPKIEWKLNQPECAVSHCDGHSVDSMAGRSAKRVPGSSFLFLFFFPAGCFFSEKQPWLVTFTICILILLPNTLRGEKKVIFHDVYLEFSFVPMWICPGGQNTSHFIAFESNEMLFMSLTHMAGS